jgi:hypothetical protein
MVCYFVAVVLVAAAHIFAALYTTPRALCPSTAKMKRTICIIGNSGTIDEAERVHSMWGAEFPVVYYSWKEDALPVRKNLRAEVWLFSDAKGRSYRDGVQYALNQAKTMFECDYFFLHDDDLTFHFNDEYPIPRPTGLTLQGELLDVLVEYKPMYATFLWEAGLKIPGLNATFSSHRSSRVYPFTAGDSGMTIYHHSIVDFFIPFSPNGEGGFVGNWTLPTHFLDLFASSVFKGIVINSLRYKNNINPDNLGVTASKWTITPDGFAVNAVSRHKYEWPQNVAYLRFLYGCLRNLEAPQARNVLDLSSVKSLQSDAFSDDVPPVLSSVIRWEVPDVVRRLMVVADPRHPALSSSHFLRRPEAQAAVRAMIPNTPINLRITIMTYRRFDNALRILKVLAAELVCEEYFISDGVYVSVVLTIDFDPKIDAKTRKNLRKKATRLYPSVRLDTASAHRGLKASWLEGWKPTLMDSFNLVLEDDLDVSPRIVRSSLRLIRSVYYKRQYPFGEILGISLFNEKTSDISPAVTQALSNLVRNSDTLRQSVCSWGAILAAPGWTEFISWVSTKGKDFDPMLKDSLSNRWPGSVPWKKLALRFAAERKMYMYNPLFPEGETLVRKLDLSGGTNDKGNMPDKISDLVATNRDLTLPSDALLVPRLDYKLEPVTSSFSSFDGCTLVMPICHRLEIVQQLLEHYTSVPFKAQIILVHQRCGGSHQSIIVPDRIKDVPIVLKRMPSNDMNNRYLNFKEIAYDCIINLDDDVMHPLESLHQLVRFWRAHFFDFYVGWTPQGRIHVIENNRYVYKNQSWVRRFDGISSMLLPSGSVYHRKFLNAYGSEPNRPARNVVSRVHNCDDVLMNFVIANATNRGPVLIDDWNSMKRSTALKALSNNMAKAQWKNLDHMKKRAACLNEFSKIYGRMPLRYTTVLYKYDHSVAKYPVRVSRKSTVCYLFSSLVPNRSTMHDSPDLCEKSGLESLYRTMACRSHSLSSQYLHV